MPSGGIMHDILVTSFSGWKPHHRSNASDDLLQLVIEKNTRPLHHLRQIPVDFDLSVRCVLERFDELKPEVLLCCGMGEKRSKLNVESRAVLDGNMLETRVDLERLTTGLRMTQISHDAGQFVCNTLYYRALEHLHAQPTTHHCIFVHVPVLTEENSQGLEEDFVAIIERMYILS